MIKRKTTEQVTKVEKRTPRKRKLKIDLSTLPDAIVDGKLIVPLKGKVLFERTLSGKTAVHEGHIYDINDNGNITIFDETVEQFYGFSMLQRLPIIKVAR